MAVLYPGIWVLNPWDKDSWRPLATNRGLEPSDIHYLMTVSIHRNPYCQIDYVATCVSISAAEPQYQIGRPSWEGGSTQCNMGLKLSRLGTVMWRQASLSRSFTGSFGHFASSSAMFLRAGKTSPGRLALPAFRYHSVATGELEISLWLKGAVQVRSVIFFISFLGQFFNSAYIFQNVLFFYPHFS